VVVEKNWGMMIFPQDLFVSIAGKRFPSTDLLIADDAGILPGTFFMINALSVKSLKKSIFVLPGVFLHIPGCFGRPFTGLNIGIRQN
jgi:hypothetical protein